MWIFPGCHCLCTTTVSWEMFKPYFTTTLWIKLLYFYKARMCSLNLPAPRKHISYTLWPHDHLTFYPRAGFYNWWLNTFSGHNSNISSWCLYFVQGHAMFMKLHVGRRRMHSKLLIKKEGINFCMENYGLTRDSIKLLKIETQSFK